MIVLNAPTLNAPDASSLTPQLQGSAQSIISSDSSAQDFSALLTELVGPGSINQLTPNTVQLPGIQTPSVQNTPQLPTLSSAAVAVPAPLGADPTQATDKALKDANTQKIQQACVPEQLKPQESPDSKKSGDSSKSQDASQVNQPVILPFVPMTVGVVAVNDQKPLSTKDETPQTQKLVDPTNAATPLNQPQAVIPQALTPEMQRAWADVKKFELTVQADTQRVAAPHAQLPVAQADVQKDAIVTTDPIANIQLQQLPPRIMAIEKLAPEAKLGDQTKPGTEKDSINTSTTTAALHFADVTKGLEQVEQVRPAHQVEIPQSPHVQVVRTVAMEVGDVDSQVTVRIQERSGDITLQINTANEPLHQDLQSSVGSLVHALRQEQVQVSNVDVSRKSPIEKVRRMKEAHS